MKLLDLFCGGGGASMGYARLGFEVTGVDIIKRHNYPFKIIKTDAMKVLEDAEFLKQFDVIHASPPCQSFSRTKHLERAQGRDFYRPDLVTPTRDKLIEWGGIYVIENVVDAPMTGIILCGSSFDLKVRRHRKFESNIQLESLPCDHKKQGRAVGIYGSMRDALPNGGRTAVSIEEAREAMGIDWLGWLSLKEAIPPAYTEYIGKQLLKHLPQ